MNFHSNHRYIVTAELALAVNAAITLQKPLLIKGEPGTGKTELAKALAASLQTDLLQWHIKSTTKAQQGLYEYDAVSRLRDSQLGDAKVHDIANYIKPGKLWQAFSAAKRPVLLIDEIDKADIEFPNDLLHELDQMAFDVYETGQTVRAVQRPVVIITSNNEKELPDAFLRRCFFHYIRFPDEQALTQIVDVHLPGLCKKLLTEALESFFALRAHNQLRKKPSTSELIDWLRLLVAEQISPEQLKQAREQGGLMPLFGALLKNEQDVALLEKLAFISKRAGR